MMNVITEQVSALHKANLEQVTKATELAFSQMERAFAWNVAVAKQFSNEAIAESKVAADVKDVQGVAALVRGTEGKTEKFASIGKSAYDHVVRTQSENAKFIENAAAEMNASYVKFIDSVAKSVPVGGDALSQQFKQFVSMQQNAAAQATQAFKQASSTAQSQWTKAAAVAQDAVVKSTKGRK